jgi:hypothetical protein
MPIQNFPAALQPIIQQGLLEHEFKQALASRLAYRAVADRESIPVRIGETITKTREGLLSAVTTPMSPSSNTNLDNGLTSQNNSVEQFTLTMAMYAATKDLNMVTDRVGIASQFVLNARILGEQARRSLDDLARNALFNAYFSGNTWVRMTLGSPATTIAVDDVRGFQYAFTTTGFNSAAQAINAGQPSPTLAAVSGSNTLTVLVNGTSYTLTGVAVDGSNVSVTPGGISGTLTFSGNVSVANGTLGNSVVAGNASVIRRPGGATTYYGLGSTNTLTMSALLDAVATLRANNVPDIGGAYNCYLDPFSARQLFADPDFKQLFQATARTTQEFQAGELENPFLGLRFVPTTEAYVQAHPTISGLYVRRPIVVGQGALIEGDFAGMAAEDVAPADSMISMVDDVCMVVREPLDRLQQIIAQSWYWIGGFCAPTDVLTNSTTIATAGSAYYKRAVMIEHVG